MSILKPSLWLYLKGIILIFLIMLFYCTFAKRKESLVDQGTVQLSVNYLSILSDNFYSW